MEIIKGILIYHFSINIIITILYLSKDLEIIIRNYFRENKIPLEYDIFSIFKIAGMLLVGILFILFKHFE